MRVGDEWACRVVVFGQRGGFRSGLSESRVLWSGRRVSRRLRTVERCLESTLCARVRAAVPPCSVRAGRSGGTGSFADGGSRPQSRVVEPDWEGVHSSQETLDDAELNHATDVNGLRVEREVVHPVADRQTGAKSRVVGEKSGEGDGRCVACASDCQPVSVRTWQEDLREPLKT